MVAVQVRDFVGEIELVLRPADSIFAAIPQADVGRKTPLISRHRKPNPLAPEFTPYPVPTPLYALAGITPVSDATEFPELGAAPPRRSFTQCEFGVQVQTPAYSLVSPDTQVDQ